MGNGHDGAKYAYHQGAGIIRAVADHISTAAYTGASLDRDEHEQLIDVLIELHQLLYGATLGALHECGDYTDEIYSDGSPVLSRVDITEETPALPIPADAYRDIGGEIVPHGAGIYVWAPGEGEHREPAEEAECEPVAWKLCADLLHRGLVAYVRGADGFIVKRPGHPSGRLSPVSAITEAGIRAHEAGR